MRGRAVIVACAMLVGCAAATESTDPGLLATSAGPTPTPTNSVSATPTPTPAAVPVPSPTPLPTATAVPKPTATAVVTATPEPSPTPKVTATTTPEPTVTPNPDPTATATSESTDPESTDPDEEHESKPDLEPTGYTGEVRAIRTAGGLVVAVRGLDAVGYEVVTPCYNVASISNGLELRGPLDVLIDPGHGGEETGAVGPNGLKESTVNLQVAELVRQELQVRGYSVELTRYSDQRVAIQSRAALANALEPRIFMSIHHNGGYPEAFPVAGTEVFIQLDDPESARLGGLVFEEVQAAFAGIEANWMGTEETFGVAWRKNQEGTDLYGVLRRTPNLVSVLTEAMFISTEAEADLLALPATLEAEATALSNAVERWFETEDPGTGHIEGIEFQGDLGNGGGTEHCVDPPLT